MIRSVEIGTIAVCNTKNDVKYGTWIKPTWKTIVSFTSYPIFADAGCFLLFTFGIAIANLLFLLFTFGIAILFPPMMLITLLETLWGEIWNWCPHKISLHKISGPYFFSSTKILGFEFWTLDYHRDIVHSHTIWSVRVDSIRPFLFSAVCSERFSFLWATREVVCRNADLRKICRPRFRGQRWPGCQSFWAEGCHRGRRVHPHW